MTPNDLAEQLEAYADANSTKAFRDMSGYHSGARKAYDHAADLVREYLVPDPTLPDRIVAAIKADLTDRRGFRQTWESVDADIQAEILAHWRELVVRELEGKS